MSPTLISGDFVIINKVIYGPRQINIWKIIFSREAEFIRYKGLRDVKNNEVIIFNYPEYEYLDDSLRFIYGTVLVKRCVGLPGSSIRIIKGKKEISYDREDYSVLYPFDSTLHWTLENYGPMYVPQKNDVLQLSPANLRMYKDILSYENSRLKIFHDSVFIEENYLQEFCIKYDYFFMLGDNFYQSKDSRYWGFLPETHIIGKATRILFSIDHNAKYFKKVRWNRILRKIESNTPEYILTDK